jgi:hypothetical protein
MENVKFDSMPMRLTHHTLQYCCDQALIAESLP